jgi:hypothetical protein
MLRRGVPATGSVKPSPQATVAPIRSAGKDIGVAQDPVASPEGNCWLDTLLADGVSIERNGEASATARLELRGWGIWPAIHVERALLVSVGRQPGHVWPITLIYGDLREDVARVKGSTEFSNSGFHGVTKLNKPVPDSYALYLELQSSGRSIRCDLHRELVIR